MEMTYKWVKCGYDIWYFIVYNSPTSFVGWHFDVYHYEDGIKFYTTNDMWFEGAHSPPHYINRPEITKVSNLKKDQWNMFLTKQRRDFPRQMIKDVFGDRLLDK